MATTLQELQDKRKELQITNPNATMLDAKSALSPSPITNAPVAWVAPAITNPTPVAPTAPVSVHDNPTYQSNTTEQYNQWVMAQNKAKAAARADTSQANPPAIIQQAQNKPLNAEEQAINNQFWWNIQSNGINDRQPLNQAITDAKTWNITAFDKIPWNIENKWSVIPPPVTIGDMYNNLVNKIDVTPEQKALPTFKIAQNRFNKANMFSSMTPAELSTEMKSAKLVEWSPAWEDLKVMNPELVRSTKALNTANGIKPEIFTYINNPDGTKVKQNNLEQSFVSDYNDNYSDIVKILTDIYKPDTAAEARAKIYTPEVRQAEEKATAIELEMNKISDIKDWIEKDLEKEYAWTWATGSRIALEKQYRNEQLTNQYNSLLKNYTTYANKANNLITQNTDLYKSEQEGKKALSTALAWVATKKYETDLSLQSKIKEQEVSDAIIAKAQNNPDKAIPLLIEQYSKLGVIPWKSSQSYVQDAKNYIAQWGNITDYLNSLTKDFQASEWFKSYQAKQTGTEWQSTNITRYNPSTWANESTPVFYRKKTNWQGGFEAVDLAGNTIDASLLSGTGTWAWAWAGTLPTSFTWDTASYIASKEWFREWAYLDSAWVPTIWYWFTSVNWKPVKIWDKITKEQADAEFTKQIERHSEWKKLIDPSKLSPSQQTALASFEYNLWPWIWNKSAMNIIDMIKSWDLQWAGKEMEKYNQAGGQVVKWLQNRRAEEARLLQSTWETATQQQFSPLQTKEFEAYNGTTIPAQYKTPMEQDQFVKDYNAWRGTRKWNKIETWNDILNIRLDKGWTEWEKVSQSYTARMLNAVNNLMPLEEKFLKLWTAWQVAQTYLPSLLKSTDQKIMEAEKKNFITAVLRKQSGASIAPSEFKWEELKYFPQPWDSQEVIIAKQNARNAEIKSMLATAWTDVEWNSLSKYYNPPIIVAEAPKVTTPTNKRDTYKKNYFTTP